ncbi:MULTISPECIES: GNAT family N-acetyltransferase [Xenorhabdus]|uniref:GNAT family N-acetyltransferase n=1 Tax=Xenorhabdus TaxID=626 RepID=UPI0006464480|nr:MULTISPECIES: GNAT family N-acetyltransferase [Xenorhabdus]
MKEKLSIRKATIEDTEDLVELRKVLLSNGNLHYSAKNKEDDLAWQKAYRSWIEKNISNKNVLLLVGTYGKDKNICSCVIGIIDLRPPIVGVLDGRICWAQSLVVRSDRRGLGIAEAMVNSLENSLIENNVHKILMQSSKIAEKFHIRKGYIHTGEELFFKII